MLYTELTQNLQEIININLEKEVVLNTIILVGSKHNVKSLDSVRNNESDLDVVILMNLNSFQINTKYKGVKYDILVINQNDIINLIIASHEGSPIAGKIFSSIKKNTIIRDKMGIASVFISVIEEVYSIFIQTSLPNHSINKVFLHNINANLTDTRKEGIVDVFFAYHRLSTHLFEYVSVLIYPFYTSGSYRGKVFKKFLDNFDERISRNTKGNPIIDDSIIKYYVDVFSPVLENDYKAVVYCSLLKNEIISGRISSFYFGYDNLILENTVLFLPEEEFLKARIRIEFVSLDLSNIVPCLLGYQIDVFNTFLITISRRYFSSSVNERKNIFNSITNKFCDNGFEIIIEQSLKTTLILKLAQEVSQEGTLIDLQGFHEWLSNLRISFLQNYDYNPLSNDIGDSLLQIFQYINDYNFLKEKEIKVSYVFFGIMKALRLNIEDLDL